MNSKAQIVATLGPASREKSIIKEMIEHHVDVIRLNFSWGTHEGHQKLIENVRAVEKEIGKRIPIIQDLSGPRVQKGMEHQFDEDSKEIITPKDLDDLKFGLEQGVDYVAMSFVGRAEDILELRKKMDAFGKQVPIIAKIERKIALDNLTEIVKTADGIMVARGDLGNEVPLEQIPFIEKDIITKAKEFKKPVIVATQMMLSMTENIEPTRAEMTDVAYAVISGADAVMLSEESASGKHPLEVVAMMERGLQEAEKHSPNFEINSL